MFSTSDTIVAVATPPGRGGIGVVRLSGPEAHAIARGLTGRDARFEPRRATFTRITSDGALVDQIIATFFPSPHSYTGDDVIELSAHGSPVILRAVVAASVSAGARLAEPGEFTLRAFLNGRIDLTQAEAVADLIDAVTPLQARAAFDQIEGTLTSAIKEVDGALFDLIARLEASVDFPDEGYHFVEPAELAAALDVVLARLSALLADARRGRLVREGLQVAIVGKPNVGKSSLFNALIGAPRAIVAEVPGTTRDLVSEVVDIEGLRVTLVDTAGIRVAVDAVEAEGVSRARGTLRVADLVLVVTDGSVPLGEADIHILMQTVDYKRVIVSNKCDIHQEVVAGFLAISARTGAGLEALRREMIQALDFEPVRDRPAITNLRQIVLVQQAQDALTRARSAVAESGRTLSEEFVLADLQEARIALEEISGRRAPDDLLSHIFARFCVGK